VAAGGADVWSVPLAVFIWLLLVNREANPAIAFKITSRMNEQLDQPDVPTLSYATNDTALRPKPPGLMLQQATVVLLCVVPILLFGMVVDFLLLSAFVAFLLAGGALAMVESARRSNRDSRLPIDMRIDSSRIWNYGIVTVLCMCFSVGLGIELMRRVSYHAKAISACTVSRSALRGLANEIQQYYRDKGEPAPTLQALVDNQQIAAKDLIEPLDDSAAVGNPQSFSSYAYFPIKGPLGLTPESSKIILAFSKVARYPRSSGLFRDWRRAIVFADGHAKMIDENAFIAALEEDRKLRRQLGWPVYLWDQATQTVIRVSAP